MLVRRLVPLLLLALAACASQPRAGGGDGASNGGGEDKAAKREAELEQAKLQLEITELEGSAAERTSGVAVSEAQRELDEAKLAAARFGEYERPSALAEAKLQLDQSAQSLRENEQELGQMEAMYAEEKNLDATGVQTRDLVLERHRKAVEFSQRRLELARERSADLEGRELPRKERELAQKLEKAQNALRKAEEESAKSALERKLALVKARQRIEELEREKAKARDKANAKPEEGGDAASAEGKAP
jgi:hypothetical protein